MAARIFEKFSVMLKNTCKIFGLCLIMLGCEELKPKYETFAGHVFDVAGNKISGAIVSVQELAFYRKRCTATNEWGAFRIDEILVGDHKRAIVSVEIAEQEVYRGYVTLPDTVEIHIVR